MNNVTRKIATTADETDSPSRTPCADDRPHARSARSPPKSRISLFQSSHQCFAKIFFFAPCFQSFYHFFQLEVPERTPVEVGLPVGIFADKLEWDF